MGCSTFSQYTVVSKYSVVAITVSGGLELRTEFIADTLEGQSPARKGVLARLWYHNRCARSEFFEEISLDCLHRLRRCDKDRQRPAGRDGRCLRCRACARPVLLLSRFSESTGLCRSGRHPGCCCSQSQQDHRHRHQPGQGGVGQEDGSDACVSLPSPPSIIGRRPAQTL